MFNRKCFQIICNDLIDFFDFFCFVQLVSLKIDFETRPTQEDYGDKIKQCNELRTELTSLTEQMANNEKLLEQLQIELSDERERHMKMVEKCLIECGIQTDDDDDIVKNVKCTKQLPEIVAIAEKNIMAGEQTAAQNESSVLSESPLIDTMESISRDDNNEPRAPITKMPQTILLEELTISTVVNEDRYQDDDDKLNNHPKVLYEDELIIFKEKCKTLIDENIRLHREINKLRLNANFFHANWLHNFMFKYLVPIVIIFIAYILFLFK